MLIMVNKALAEMVICSPRCTGTTSRAGAPASRPKLLRAMPAGAVLDSLRAPADGADAIQPAVSLVHWPVDGRRGVGATVFTKNRQRLIEHDAVVAFFNAVLKQATKERSGCPGTLQRGRNLDSSLGGPQELRAQRRQDDDDGGEFRGKSRSNGLHESALTQTAGCFAKGKTAGELRLHGSYADGGNRNGLIVNAMVTRPMAMPNAEAAKAMVADVRQTQKGEITLGADKELRRGRVHRALRDMKGHATCGAEQVKPQVSGA